MVNKSILDSLKDKIKGLNGIKDDSLKKLENLKSKIVKELDEEIKKVYDKKELKKDVKHRKHELKFHKETVWKSIKNARIWMLFRYLVSMPFIYLMLIPTIGFHFFLEVYHNVCFRLYGIPLVRAGKYFVFDRVHLPYLNWLEKINCLYCSYYNCLIAYAREIGARTERYWCPIKHSMKMKDEHDQYEHFFAYNEPHDLRENWEKIRKFK